MREEHGCLSCYNRAASFFGKAESIGCEAGEMMCGQIFAGHKIRCHHDWHNVGRLEETAILDTELRM